MITKIIPLFICLTCSLVAASFQRPQLVTESEWEQLQPYLLPADHPIRAKLDAIFTRARVTESAETLKKAKFKYKKGAHRDNLYVAKHASLGKYLLKLYTDDQVHVNEVLALTKRIQGANLIRGIIDRDHMHRFFKVPQKWLYPLSTTKEHEKRFLLVVEDMKVMSEGDNWDTWRSSAVTKEHLVKLHAILMEAGLYDSVYIDNIPFSKDGKIAFIDTEHFNLWPIRIGHISKNLSARNKTYWESL